MGSIATAGLPVIDLRRGCISFTDGRRYVLSPAQANILTCLLSKRGRAVSREELIVHLWGPAARQASTRTVDMHVCTLRRMLHVDQYQTQAVITVHRFGYKFDPNAVVLFPASRSVPRPGTHPTSARARVIRDPIRPPCTCRYEDSYQD
jgi:DNA-binding winged helix-turn-helix (wHTH) protein